MNVGVPGDDANGLKEARERYDYEKHLRKQYLAKKYGKERGKEAFEAEERDGERARATR